MERRVLFLFIYLFAPIDGPIRIFRELIVQYSINEMFSP